MKLTCETYDEVVTIETEKDDVVIDEMMDLVKRLLLAASWQPETIAPWFSEDCKDNN